jgi:hypothetical protein
VLGRPGKRPARCCGKSLFHQVNLAANLAAQVDGCVQVDVPLACQKIGCLSGRQYGGAFDGAVQSTAETEGYAGVDTRSRRPVKMRHQLNKLVVLSKLACSTPVPGLALGGTSLAADRLAIIAMPLDGAVAGAGALAGMGFDAQAVSNRALVTKPRLRRVRN